MTDMAAYLLVGRLVIFLAQTAGVLRWFWKLHPLLQELRDCDLCLGVWVYFVLAFIWPMAILPSGYIPCISEALTGASASFVMHLLRLGWNARFQSIIITGEPSAIHDRLASGQPEEPTQGPDSHLG